MVIVAIEWTDCGYSGYICYGGYRCVIVDMYRLTLGLTIPHEGGIVNYRGEPPVTPVEPKR